MANWVYGGLTSEYQSKFGHGYTEAIDSPHVVGEKPGGPVKPDCVNDILPHVGL